MKNLLLIVMMEKYFKTPYKFVGTEKNLFPYILFHKGTQKILLFI